MKIKVAECPKCGASVKFEDNINKKYCEYCGTQIILDDEVQRIEYKIIDEAKMKEAEYKNEADKRDKLTKIFSEDLVGLIVLSISFIIMAIIVLIIFLIWKFS